MEIPEYDVAPCHLAYSDKLVHSIGAFLMACADVESSMLVALCRVLSHPHPVTVNILTTISGMDLRVKLEKIQIASHMLSLPLHEELKRPCDVIQDMFATRNALAHHTSRLGNGDSITVSAMRINRNGKHQASKVFSRAIIIENTKKLYNASAHIDRLITKYGIVKIEGGLPMANLPVI